MDQLAAWEKARAGWLLLVVCAVPASAYLWLVGGFGFCGTDTTDPGRAGDWACVNLVRPVVPWAVIALMPIAALLVGGWIALRLRDWRVLTVVLAVPCVLLVACPLALMALF
jgi:hypothetical protein